MCRLTLHGKDNHQPSSIVPVRDCTRTTAVTGPFNAQITFPSILDMPGRRRVAPNCTVAPCTCRSSRSGLTTGILGHGPRLLCAEYRVTECCLLSPRLCPSPPCLPHRDAHPRYTETAEETAGDGHREGPAEEPRPTSPPLFAVPEEAPSSTFDAVTTARDAVPISGSTTST
ncbi:hypothetical protein CCUS01_00277 [Colletotrichum cuscutae]|uniref:Uncharacterized protein n=1 Tax=Colletotrichum cuscutae TaxID=1209917 RepID=A0AAI9YE44_9PEZI|nr:hypothetical protein CCUS01_00277 [Colletotrichum cuscutae]